MAYYDSNEPYQRVDNTKTSGAMQAAGAMGVGAAASMASAGAFHAAGAGMQKAAPNSRIVNRISPFLNYPKGTRAVGYGMAGVIGAGFGAYNHFTQ